MGIPTEPLEGTVDEGEIPAVWRLLLAGGIVAGVILFGLVVVYSWFFVAPLLVLGGLLTVLFRRMLREP